MNCASLPRKLSLQWGKKSDEYDDDEEKRVFFGSLNQQITECSAHKSTYRCWSKSIFCSRFSFFFFNSAEKSAYFIWKMFWIYIRSDFHMNDFHFSMRNKSNGMWFVCTRACVCCVCKCMRKWVGTFRK